MTTLIIAALERSLTQTSEPGLRQQLRDTIKRLKHLRHEGGSHTPSGDAGHNGRRREGARRFRR